MIPRAAQPRLEKLLAGFPAVALLGPRQAGKTTLARALADALPERAVYLDLELPSDRAKLSDAELYLSAHEGRLVILDEIQRAPGLFQVLRGVIDRRRRKGIRAGEFLLLGSAAMDLLRQSAESLAGRIAYLELPPFVLPEVEHLGRDAWSARKRSRFSAAPGSRSCSFTSRVSAAGCGRARNSRTMAPMRRPNSSGRPGPSPFQNGILPGSPGAGVTSTRSCVMSTMRHVDAPRMKVSFGMRLEDHLLVEFAHAHRFALGECKKNAIKSAVGNGSGVENRQPRRAVARRDHVAHAIPRQSRAQLGELVGRVAPAQQIEHALKGRARKRAERRRAPHQVEERIDGDFGGEGLRD